jgi:hypothetical protein
VRSKEATDESDAAIHLNIYRSHETDQILSLDQLLFITRLDTATSAERDELVRQIEGPLADYIKTIPVETSVP